MTKRILSLLLVLCMLASLMVFPVSAAEEAESTSVTQAEELCPCGCGKTLDAVTWKPWAVNGIDGPTSGHNYLDSDITYAQLQEAAHKAVLYLRAQENADQNITNSPHSACRMG